MDGGGRFLFALKSKLLEFEGSVLPSAHYANLRVLPRLLRWPVRFLKRLLDGHIIIPKHAEGFGITAIIGGAIVYGSVMGGQFAVAVDSVTAKSGFAVSEIEISGNTHTTANDVFAALRLGEQRSLVSIDPDASREALKQLPWVGAARIAKVYPDKLKIDIEERDAFAVWQQGEALTVVQKDGSVIGGYAADARLSALPFLVGKGAAENGEAFVETVAKFDDLAGRVRAFIRVGTRRWNLRLDNGMTIRLPDEGLEDALARLTDLQIKHGVLDRDLAAIDLRLKDRTIFALTENAQESREAFVKARADAAKKERKARGSRI